MSDSDEDDICNYILHHDGNTINRRFLYICADILEATNESKLPSLQKMKIENKYFINGSHCIDYKLLMIETYMTPSQMGRLGDALVDLMDAFKSMNRKNLLDSTRERIIRDAITIFFQALSEFHTTTVRRSVRPQLANDEDRSVVLYGSSALPKWSWFGKTSGSKVSLYRGCIGLVVLDLAARASMTMYGINFYEYTSNEKNMHTAALAALLGGNAFNRLRSARVESDEPKGIVMFILLELFKTLSIIWLQYVANAPGWSDVTTLHNYSIDDTVLLENIHQRTNLEDLKSAGVIDHMFIAFRQLVPFLVSLLFLDGKDKWTRFLYSVSFANHAMSNIPGAVYSNALNRRSDRFEGEHTYSGYVDTLKGHIKTNWHVGENTKLFGIANIQDAKHDALAFLMLADTHLEPWKDPVLGADAFTWALKRGFVEESFSAYHGKHMKVSADMKVLLPFINNYFLRMPFARFSFETIVQRVAKNLESDSICEGILGREHAYSQSEIRRFKKVMGAIRPTIEAFLASFYARYPVANSVSILEKWGKQYGDRDAATIPFIQEIDHIFSVYLKDTLHIRDGRFGNKGFLVDYPEKK
jgi:hypothetical protein